MLSYEYKLLDLPISAPFEPATRHQPSFFFCKLVEQLLCFYSVVIENRVRCLHIAKSRQEENNEEMMSFISVR